MRLARLFAIPLLAAALFACGGPTEFEIDGPMYVRASAESVTLHNRTSQPVYVFLVERESAALIDWAPCPNPDTCDGLAPGERRTIRYEQIAGYERGEKEALFYWWHLMRQPGGSWGPDEIRYEIIRL